MNEIAPSSGQKARAVVAFVVEFRGGQAIRGGRRNAWSLKIRSKLNTARIDSIDRGSIRKSIGAWWDGSGLEMEIM